MKKLVVFLSLILGLAIAFARPPVEGDVLDGNDFVFGIDVTGDRLYRIGNTEAPYLYNNLNIDGQYISIPSYIKSEENIIQDSANLGINLRYGLFNYFEVFGNANGYYQSSSEAGSSKTTQKFNFAGANIGLMVTLYKGDNFHLIIGDNSDIVNNAIFDNSTSSMQLFKGHTFFLNFIKQKEQDGKFVSMTAQTYYRLNLKQNYKDFDFRNGDEFGVKGLLQIGKENKLGFIELSAAFRNSDIVNGTRLYSRSFGGRQIGFGGGWKQDISNHLGYKISVNYTNYAIDYNANNLAITLGLYFK